MASLEKIALLIFLLVMSSIDGIVLRLRTADHKRGACLSDEQYYAIAPIQTLSKITGASSANGWLASVNESIDEFDCIPDVRCKRWSSNTGAARMSSYESSVADFGFLKTRGWHYLPEYITDGSDNFISPAIYIGQLRPAPIKMKMSILAKDKFSILLTGHEEWQGKPGVFIQLGAYGNWAALCSNMAKSLKDSNCSPPNYFSPSITNFLNGSWVHLLLKTTEASYSLKTELTIDGNKAQHTTNFHVSRKLEVKFATFRSSMKPSVIKLHNFNLTNLAQKTYYDFQFSPKKLSNLRSFTFTFVLRSESRIKLDQNVEIDDSLLNKQKIKNNVTTIGEFKRYFINIADATVKEKIKISLTPDGNVNLISFGLLLKEPFAYYMDGNLTACQVLGTDQVTSTNRIDTNTEIVIPDMPIDSVCKKLKADNCRGVEACSPSGCYCFSGHTDGPSIDNNYCRDECKSPYFGPNCVRRIKTECKKGKYDIHTGCSECQKLLRPPDCSNAVLVFQQQPTIFHRGAYSVIVSVERAFTNLSPDARIHFARGELQLLQNTNIKKRIHIKSLDATTFTFTPLQHDTEYTLRLVFFEANDLHDVEKSPNATFKMEKCLDLSENDMKISFKNEHIIITNWNPDTCPVGQYKVYQDGKEIINQGKFDVAKSLKDFPKYSNYTVKFFVNMNEIEGVELHFKIPREEKLKESPLLLGVTETSVRVSLKEEISTISSLMILHFFHRVQIITRELETRKVLHNMTLDLRSASKELLIDGLNSGLEYTIKASVVDKDPTVPVEASTSAHFITKKCTQPTKSNILFINSEEETSMELIHKKKYTCDFSLYLKTPRGKENTTWERNYYKFTLRRIPNDAESLILEFDSGEPIEFMFFTSTPFLSGYDSVIVLLPCSTLLCILQSFMLMSLLPMLENKPKHL